MRSILVLSVKELIHCDLIKSQATDPMVSPLLFVSNESIRASLSPSWFLWWSGECASWQVLMHKASSEYSVRMPPSAFPDAPVQDG